jgi:phage gp36-like protein
MYCSIQDIINRISEDVLIRLTDDKDTGMIDETKVNEAIEEAVGEIDAYAQSRYTLPFNPVPKIIKKLTVDLAIYSLFARRGLNADNNEDQVIIQQRKDAVKFLENLARGLITIGPAPEQTQKPESGVIVTGPGRVFSREKMRDF